jgi:hypothetical protein
MSDEEYSRLVMKFAQVGLASVIGLQVASHYALEKRHAAGLPDAYLHVAGAPIDDVDPSYQHPHVQFDFASTTASYNPMRVTSTTGI